MLLGNMRMQQRTPGRFLGGNTTQAGTGVTSSPSGLRSNFNSSGPSRNVLRGILQQLRTDGSKPNIAAIPSGYKPGSAWIIPFTDGEAASTVFVGGGGEIAPPNLAGGLNAVATLDGVGQIANAAGGLVVSAVATILGLGEISPAPNITGVLQATAALTGEGIISAASLGALAGAVASLSGVGTVTSLVNGLGNITADIIVIYTATATTTDIANAVWEALASEHNATGTMGQKMNQALSLAKFLGLK